MSSGSLALASARQARLFAQAAGTVGSEFGHERARERESEREWRGERRERDLMRSALHERAARGEEERCYVQVHN